MSWILVSPQLILPGSPDYRMLLQMPGMNAKYGSEDLIDIVGINRDFLKYFSPHIRREEILEEIKDTFGEIKKKRPELILDVKGVVKEEEEYIDPNRPYAKI